MRVTWRRCLPRPPQTRARGEEKIKYYYDENGNKFTVVYAPTQAQIETARAAYELAKATLTEAKYYYAALNGEEIPVDATGSALAELQKQWIP
jgi:hypothetical protein